MKISMLNQRREGRGAGRRVCKSLLVALVVALITPQATLADVEINETNFPDVNFRAYLQSQTYGQDNTLTTDEIKSITKLDISGLDIASVKGIQNLSYLRELDCHNNKIEKLNYDLVNLTTLNCANNELSELDAYTWLENIVTLDCSNNKITTLELPVWGDLKVLDCSNNMLKRLDAACCETLDTLKCSNNALTDLLLTNGALWVCEALKYLDCSGNNLTKLNLSGQKLLTYLNCSDNKIYGENMDALIECLPNVSNGSIYVYAPSANDDNICTWNQVVELKENGWIAYTDAEEYGGLTEWTIGVHKGHGRYWATLYAPFGYELPEGTEAYAGVVNEEAQSLVLTSIGRNVPRGMPVIIKGNNASVVAAVDDRIAAEAGENALVGKYEPFDATGTDVYTLGIYEEIVGFYKYKGTVGRLKAVLELPEGIKANSLKVLFEDDDITAIEDANTIVDNANAVYYDLQGRRVAEPQKGQLYIVNGKTIIQP